MIHAKEPSPPTAPKSRQRRSKVTTRWKPGEPSLGGLVDQHELLGNFGLSLGHLCPRKNQSSGIGESGASQGEASAAAKHGIPRTKRHTKRLFYAKASLTSGGQSRLTWHVNSRCDNAACSLLSKPPDCTPQPQRPAQTAVHLPPIARHHGRSSTIVVSTMGPLIQNCHPCRSSTRPCALCAPRLPRRHGSLRTNALPPLPTRWAPISRLLLSVTHLYLDCRLLCRFDFPLLVSMRMSTLL